MAVVKIDADEVKTEAGVAGEGPGGVARQDVDFAGLQGGEALLGGERRVAVFLGVAEERRGDGSAEIDVDAAPLAVAIGLGETGQTGVHAALNEALLERAIGGGAGMGAGRLTAR